MAEQRPLVLLNGHLQQLPVGDDLTQHKALIVTAAGEVRQLSDAEDIFSFQPLVLIGSEIQELPVGDTLAGVSVIVDLTIHDITSGVVMGPYQNIVIQDLNADIIHGPSNGAISLAELTTSIVHGPSGGSISLAEMTVSVVHGPTQANVVMSDLTSAVILGS